jgi:hypothetical protein
MWAFKSSLEIPLAHISEIRADPAIAHGWWHGLRMPGTKIPGVLTAGTFYQDGKRVFWDVKINRPNLFAPCFSAKRPKIKQFGRLIST